MAKAIRYPISPNSVGSRILAKARKKIAKIEAGMIVPIVTYEKFRYALFSNEIS